MNEIAASVYWIIVVIWIGILFTVISFYVVNRRTFGTTRLLLVVLALDAVRNIVENTYFGLYFGSKYGFFSSSIEEILGNPFLLILPKVGNIGAGCLVLGVLLFRWLPEAIHERAQTERHTEYLHLLATTDSMTGLQNRGSFMAIAEVEWQRHEVTRCALSLLMIDIDFFKSVNDLYGHQAGDHVIVMVASACRKRKRAIDIAGRLGGEEFAILVKDADVAAALNIAERIRNVVAEEVTKAFEMNLSVTVSVGVSSAQNAASLAEFFRQADAALYEAKRSGRNRVCSFGGVTEGA